MSTSLPRRPLRALVLTVVAALIAAASPYTAPGRIAGWVKDSAGTAIANAQVFVSLLLVLPTALLLLAAKVRWARSRSAEFHPPQ